MNTYFRKRMTQLSKFGATFLILILASKSGFTQPVNNRLTFGDVPPPLVYSSWIKGSPISGFDGEKIFVLEFWATWCVPCIASMPHLSELADKYHDKVRIIAVDASERTGKQPYSSCTSMVKAFVEKNAEKMRFDVLVDNDERGMTKNWLQKAGISGIPATIVIKNNRIQWIGYPQKLEAVLDKLVSGEYNLVESKEQYESALNTEAVGQKIYRTNVARIDSAVSAGNYGNAIAFAEESAKIDVQRASSYGLKKLSILMAHYPENEALKFMETCEKENSSWALSYACFIGGQDGLNLKHYQIAAEILERCEQTNIFFLDELARLQGRLGKYEKAVVAQQKAIKMLKERQEKKPTNENNATIVSFEKKSEAYRASASEKKK
jgi:thiol-disulfide isomerase/thioredoxin